MEHWDGTAWSIEHWDGTIWSIVPAPYSSQSDFNSLYAVKAIATNDVWTVGYQNENEQGQNGQGFIVHWDGTQWLAVTSPIAGNATVLLGVTANSSTDVTLVGYVYHSDHSMVTCNRTLEWKKMDCPADTKSGSGGPALRRGVERFDLGGRGILHQTQFEGYMVDPLTLIMKNR